MERERLCRGSASSYFPLDCDGNVQEEHDGEKSGNESSTTNPGCERCHHRVLPMTERCLPRVGDPLIYVLVLGKVAQKHEGLT